MRRRRYSGTNVLLAMLPALSLAAGAQAAELRRPTVGPAESWVKVAPLPPEPKADGAATLTLLTDNQERFDGATQTVYFATAYKIATAQGLSDAALQIDWDPATEAVTVHRYRLLREGKWIDLLGDGSRINVVQREKNLESASLDGRLTASIQPEDVRVGDIVEMAFSRRQRDPAFGGHSEALVGPSDGNFFGHYRLRLLWPDSKTLQWKVYPGVLAPRVTHTAAGSELVAEFDNQRTSLPPRGAPARFGVVNAVDISEFPDWAAVSRSFEPLFAKTSALSPDSPVKAEARRIAALTDDPQRRAELALATVQEKVRYLFLGMNDGGFVPAPADLSWARRYGDCKAKTVLLVALLRELGIAARPVLVHTESGDFVAHRLPSMEAFDHVIVQANVAGHDYWMDGTRMGDTKLAQLRTPNYRVGLPVTAAGSPLVPMLAETPDRPSDTTSLALDASAGIDVPAVAVGEMRVRGVGAIDMQIKYAALSAADRVIEFRKLWRKTYDFVEPTSVSARIDERTGDYVLAMRGTAQMSWFEDSGTRWYELDRARLGWKFDTNRDGMVSGAAPFSIDYPDFSEARETIKLPDGGRDFRLQGSEPVDTTVAAIYALHRKVDLAGGTLTMEASTRALAAELPFERAERARTELASLSTVGVYVRVPESYVPTPGDLAALQKDKPKLVKAMIRQASFDADDGRQPKALGELDEALKVDPKAADAFALKAMILALQSKPEADAAADRAIALNDRLAQPWRAKAVLAVNQNRAADGETLFNRAIGLDDKDERLFLGRGLTRLDQSRFAEALSDFDAALALSPTMAVHYLRAQALIGLNRRDEASAEVDRDDLAKAPDDILAKRASLRIQLGERDKALVDLSTQIERAPTAALLIERGGLWDEARAARRDEDIAAALRIDPKSEDALALRAEVAIGRNDPAAVERDLARIERLSPTSRIPYLLRIEILEKQGLYRAALKVADARIAATPKDAEAFNSRCWLKATRSMEVETAAADCDEALRLMPQSPAYLDSRAFAELRAGSIDTAIHDYDAALKIAPRLAASLYGRAIAHARLGHRADALGDLAAALKVAPGIEGRFAEYGVRMPESIFAAPAAVTTRR